MASYYTLSKAAMEIYTLEEVEEEEEEKDSSKKKEEEEDSDKKEEEEESTEPKTGFELDKGEICQIDYLDEIYSDSFESDYTDISYNATVSTPIEHLDKFYKGRRVCLMKGLQRNDKTFKWKDLVKANDGYITEMTYNKDKVEIKISGMDKLLEENAVFEFSQMKRSEIITAIIEEAGLIPVVDPSGLNDDVIDFKSGSNESSDDGTATPSGSESIDEAVKNAIKGKTSDLDKAKAIDSAFKSYIIYSYYYDCKYANDLEAAWKAQNLNCADGANVLCAMFTSAGLKATIVHVPNHYIVRLSIGGQTYYTDNAANTGSHTTRPFGQVWNGNTSGSDCGTHLSY